MNYHRHIIFSLLAILLCAGAAYSDGVYTKTKEQVNGNPVHVAHLTLHPTPESKPAMKYRLLTDPAYQVDRNANIYYLKANGFFDASSAQAELKKRIKATAKFEDHKDPKLRNKCIYNWYGCSPDDLPLDEVKSTLGLLRFQTRELDQAERCRFADFGHQDIFEMENPYMYPLSEIQSIRSIARWQSVRCKVAIREGRIEDAIKILRQQYMHSMHMGQDVFIISSLVGIAIGGIADNDLLYLIQEPECPSLYWALAAIPRPLCDASRVISIEKRLGSAYFPYYEKMGNIDSQFTKDYWPIFADKIFKTCTSGLLDGISQSSPAKGTENHSQVAAAMFVISAYPKARRYLIEDLGVDRKKVDSFPAVRVVAMATTLAFNDLFDETTKFVHLPPEEALVLADKSERQMSNRYKRIGMASFLSRLLGPACSAFNTAIIRQQQNFNISQTLEALRIYAYQNDGELPTSLEKLNPPAQKNPFTGKHFPYNIEDGKAIMDAPGPPGYHRRYIVEMKPVKK